MKFFTESREEMLATLEAMVSVESPSTDKHQLDLMVNLLKEKFSGISNLGCEVIPHDVYGNVLRCVLNPDGDDQVLLVGHYDTVFPVGTLSRMHVRREDDRLYGPGAFDMKGGIVQALFALRYCSKNMNASRKIVFLITGDEEIESTFSRSIIIEEAKRSRYALVLEPSLAGKLKTERKGVATVYLKVTGRSAHAGLDPEKGINAIYEMSGIIEKIRRYSGKNSLMVNVDKIRGGTRSNVIPDSCEIEIDIRFSEDSEFESFINYLESLELENNGASKSISFNKRGSLKKSRESVELFSNIRDVARGLDMEIQEASVSGGSDASYTSKFCPTIDGLGAVGGGAHSSDEHVLIHTLPERAALLASILMNI